MRPERIKLLCVQHKVISKVICSIKIFFKKIENKINETTEAEKTATLTKLCETKVITKKKTLKKDEKADKRVKNSSLWKGAATNFVNIDRNISSSTSQPGKQPIQTRTLIKDDFSSSNEIINSNQDNAYSDKAEKDLMLLNRLSLETGVNDDSQGRIKPTQKHILQRNSSLRSSSRRKT